MVTVNENPLAMLAGKPVVLLLSGGLDNLGDSLTYAVSLAVVGSSLQTKAKVAFLKLALSY